MIPLRPERPLISLVIPMHNEEAGLDLLFERIRAVMAGIEADWEAICVNDGSRDGTLSALINSSAKDPRIKVVNLSRNFGKEAALTAGLDHAQGDAVVPLDADLQDPPELIADFVAEWRKGAEVVYGVRRRRDEDSPAKRMTATLFYRLFNTFVDVRIPTNTGDFRLMDRCVVEALSQFRERSRFMKGLFSWVGFKQVPVYYDRPARAAGTTSFNYWSLWNFAIDGVTGFSTAPLRIWSYIGIGVSIFAFLYGLYLFYRTLVNGIDLPGYASIMVSMLFLGGVQLISLGVIGEYLGRLYHETKQRPLYIVASRHGLPQPAIKAAGSETIVER